MSLDIWFIEPTDLKGKRSKKGKKRTKGHKLGQAIHPTKNGDGCIARLRKGKRGTTKSN
jgi:hypothetical protein